jgi:hypothetical protein
VKNPQKFLNWKITVISLKKDMTASLKIFYQGFMKAWWRFLSRFYQDFIKALSKLYQGFIKALSKLYQGFDQGWYQGFYQGFHSRFFHSFFSWLFLFTQVFLFFITASNFHNFWYFYWFSKSKSSFVAFYSIFSTSGHESYSWDHSRKTRGQKLCRNPIM